MAEMLDMWVVTQNPADHPGKFVARKWVISGGDIAVTMDHHTADTINEVRGMLPPHLNVVPRHPNDDPVIVESWI